MNQKRSPLAPRPKTPQPEAPQPETGFATFHNDGVKEAEGEQANYAGLKLTIALTTFVVLIALTMGLFYFGYLVGRANGCATVVPALGVLASPVRSVGGPTASTGPIAFFAGTLLLSLFCVGIGFVVVRSSPPPSNDEDDHGGNMQGGAA